MGIIGWILIIFGGLAPFIGVGIYYLLQPKPNIKYIITQTFHGNIRVLLRVGFVVSDPKMLNMATHTMLVNGVKKEIGTFHQKYLHTTDKGSMVLMLEEFDIGRYRPMIKGEVKKMSAEFKNVSQGEREDDNTIIEVQGVPNEDIDWILGSRDKIRQVFAKQQQEKYKWLPYIMGGIVVLFVFLGLIATSYYNYMASQTHEKTVERIAKTFDPATQTERIIKAFVNEMVNGTVRDVIKEKEEPPRPPGE